MKSTMTHQFSQVPKADIPRSSFDRSHGLKTTFDAGYLVPIFVDEALPGDTFNLDMTGFARMATPIFPIMDNVFMETFFFAVPNRLVWDNWQKFCGEQTNPGDSTDYTVPVFSTTGAVATGSVADYFGLPISKTNLLVQTSSLPFRALNLIYNEWFRDQNLQNSVPVATGDGPDTYTDYSTLRRRGKRHDYFTSCLPWPQKGDSVDIPLGTTAPIGWLSASTGAAARFADLGGGTNQASLISAGTGGAVTLGAFSSAAPEPNVFADLSQATSATINQLRQAFQIQKLLERDARGGSRYTEIIKAHFGVTSPDARLQRPEYLGGGSSRINIAPVPQTSESGTTPQGTLAATGTASLRNHGFTKSFTEHTIIIGLVSVRADLTYQQGLNRMWSRQTRYDFYWPALAHIGEQAVLNKEIFFQGTTPDSNVFGYQERYAEYRYKPSQVTGLFRSDAVASLDSWHLAQDFASLPVLDSTFIQETPPFDRVVAVPTEPDFLFDAYFNLRCARPMPLYGVPGLIDHF